MRVRIVALVAVLVLAACSIENPVTTRTPTEQSRPSLNTQPDSANAGATGVTAAGGLFGSGH